MIGETSSSNFVYNGDFLGGVHVGVTNLAGDNFPDLVTGPGAGGTSLVVARDGVTGDSVEELIFRTGFAGGVFVAGSLTPPIDESTLRADGSNPITQSGIAEPKVTEMVPPVSETVRQFDRVNMGLTNSLSEFPVRIADSPSNRVGVASSQIDRTPNNEVELQLNDAELLDRVDLLSVISQEWEHTMRLEQDEEPTFMAERPLLATRRRVAPSDFRSLDSLFSNHVISDLLDVN